VGHGVQLRGAGERSWWVGFSSCGESANDVLSSIGFIELYRGIVIEI
jgi:hypothetical protein